MTSLQSISGSLLYYLIGIFVIFLVVGQTAESFQAVRNKRDKKHLIVSVINLLLCFALLIVLMDFCQSRVVSPEDYLLYKPLQLAIVAQPWLWIVCGELICTVILILLFRSDFKYRKKHLTPDATHLQKYLAEFDGFVLGK